ncbi:adenosine deaminase [Micavibrio aeruginosavorus]|uniref:Adenosine deaminase n=1 Tax=Micavibrio aeruginosavorus EPB TaxID=349215 RepID=M4VGW2_9BACT|nr:adenosine deaminase [Micavibrio aeruginosavorus]AGH97725.1 Adenosine deaminase [Micavibrio aeruginosavorus EPB]
MQQDSTRNIPKAELHVHVEGTVRPDIARQLAKKNGVTLPDDIFTPDGQGYQWSGFIDLVTRVYQAMAQCVRTRDDFKTITEDYLDRCAKEGAVYVEIIACCGQTHLSGISYKDMIDGIADGIDAARAKHGIEARINMTFERHRPGVEAQNDADMILSYKHPYIVGLDIAGGEMAGDIPQFLNDYNRVVQNFGRPLGIRLHAAENVGPQNGWDALALNPTRLGHGVRIIEDDTLVNEIVQRGIALEVCPTSNILAGVYPDFAAHPLKKLMDRGVRISLNSDDPGLFGNSIGEEYRVAHDEFGLTRDQLVQVTRDAINDSYADAALKTKLLARVDAMVAANFNVRRPGPAPSP